MKNENRAKRSPAGGGRRGSGMEMNPGASVKEKCPKEELSTSSSAPLEIPIPGEKIILF
jgi:hypothetical protein